MTTAAWPADLNQNHEPESYNEEPEDNVARFDPEVGPSKMRQRSFVPCDLLSFSTILTSAERATLLTFYKSILKNGTGQFTRRHPVTRLAQTFVFTAPPKISALSRSTYRASISLRLMP